MPPTVPIRIRRLEQLVDFCRNLSNTLELGPLLTSIVNAACELTLSEASSIFLYEEETGLLKFIAAPKNHFETVKRIRVPLENSVAGQCFTQSQPVIIQNDQPDHTIFREVDHSLDFETRSILAVPLVYRHKTIGVLEAVNKRNNAHYTVDDVTILDTLASQTAIALQNNLLGEEAQQAYDQLLDLDEMKAEFIAITSHELRTPLGLILGYASVLKDALQDEESRAQLDVIIHNANRLKEIAEDLVNADQPVHSRTREQKQRLDLNLLIEDVAASFQEDAREKQISLRVDQPQSAVWLKGEGEKIAIALSNLIKNALSFTDRGGHVLVQVEDLPGYARVSVVDDGIGIPSAELNRVFDRFYQVESHMTRRHGGMGLGLSVAKVMIEMHNGYIWVESQEGKGSRFSFLLPKGSSREPPKSSAFIEQGD
jgi:signal transduction histidine kinase